MKSRRKQEAIRELAGRVKDTVSTVTRQLKTWRPFCRIEQKIMKTDMEGKRKTYLISEKEINEKFLKMPQISFRLLSVCKSILRRRGLGAIPS